MGKKSNDKPTKVVNKVGKRYVPVNYNEDSRIGAPNTYAEYYDIETGKFIRRRIFGNDGFAKIDLDVPHNHNDLNHKHIWGIIKGKEIRHKCDKLTKKEDKKFERIIMKRGKRKWKK